MPTFQFQCKINDLFIICCGRTLPIEGCFHLQTEHYDTNPKAYRYIKARIKRASAESLIEAFTCSEQPREAKVYHQLFRKNAFDKLI